MQQITAEQYKQVLTKLKWQPFTMSLPFCLSQADEQSLLFFVDNVSNPYIACCAFKRRKWGATMLLIKGECLNENISSKAYKHFYEDIAALDYDLIELNLNTHYSAEREVLLRQAGWLRPIGMFSTTLSKIVTTAIERSYDKSWTRNLKSAADNNLLTTITNEPTLEQLKTYCELNDELLKRKQFNDSLSVKQLQSMFADKRFNLCFIHDSQKQIVAGGIFYMHPEASTFLYSFTTQRGRELSASYWLYKQLLDYLFENGIEHFDLGRISPAKHAKNNIFLFKDGIQGSYVQYMGEWQICKRKWMPYALCLLKNNYWRLTRV